MNVAGLTPGHRWQAWVPPLLAVFLLQLTSSLVLRAAPTLAPVLALRLGWRAETIGYLAVAVTVGTLAFLLVGMPFIRRVGPMRALQMGMALVALGCLMQALPWVAAVWVGSLLMGWGMGPGSSAANVVLSRYAPQGRQGVVFSLKQAGVPAGSILAGLMLPALAVHGGVALAMGVAAALALVSVCVVQAVRRGVDADRQRQQSLHWRVWLSPQNLANLRRIWATPALRRAGLAGACLAVGQGSWFVYLVTYLVKELGYTLQAAGALFALMQGASLVGRPLMGWVADRMARAHWVLAGAGVGSTVATLLLAAMTPHWPTWAVVGVAVLAGCTVSGWNGVQIMNATRLAPPGQVAEASGGVALITFLGFALAPLVMALGHAVTGSLAGAFLLAGLLTLGVVPFQDWHTRRSA